MRPLRLEMQAFGPFPKREILDFREISDRSLFLIHGPTGAGKTFILDAVCFALYGVCSGSSRDTKTVRSDHADPSVQTEISLEFGLRGQSFRVFRKPEQAKQGLKGLSKKISSEAWLSRISENPDDNGTGTIIASKWKHVTEKVETLLGFRADQFTQVVILPQGEFRELLLASSKDRQGIMEVLFQTEFYRRVEEALKKSAKNVEFELINVKREKEIILNQAQCESGPEIQDRFNELSEFTEKITKDIEIIRDKLGVATERLNECKKIADRFTELSEARNSLSVIEEGRSSADENRLLLERAKNAELLVQEEIHYRKRLDDAEQSQARLKMAVAERKAAAYALEIAHNKLESANSCMVDLTEAREDATRLNDLTQKVENYAQVCKKFEEVDSRFERACTLYIGSQRELENCVEQIEQLRLKKTMAQAIASEFDYLSLKIGELEKAISNIERLKFLNEDHENLAKQTEQVTEKIASIRLEMDKTEIELAELEATWFGAQSAILAARLVEGQACPVCGSIEHPTPAKWQDNLPTEEDLKKKKLLLNALHKQYDTRSNEKTSVEKRLGEIAATRLGVLEALGEHSGQGKAGLSSQLKELRIRFQQSESAKKDLQTFEEREIELAGMQSKYAQKQKERLSDKNAAAETRKAVEGQLSGLGNEIPEELRDKTCLERAKHKVADTILRLETAFRQAEKLFHDASGEMAARESAEKELRQTAEDNEKIACSSRETFFANISELGFKDPSDYMDAKKFIQQIQSISKQIQSFDEGIRSSKDRFERAAEAVRGVTLPDPATFEQAEKAAKEDWDSAIQKKARAEERLSALKNIRRNFQGLNDRENKLEDKYAVVGKLARVAGGENSQKITFQRFVMAALLDDVLFTASRRLNIMSNGRYSLYRSLEQKDKRLSGGLDIEVHDHYTGIPRPANTLSGGESFLASLSLALGLADVVQSYAGGIRLETIFIDEGFGSLDPESLDLAFRALVDLQREGRLVGIISHVPDLKERVPCRLEVTSGRFGSTANFVV
jgi:DNA repair protein SbcC/Rad50